MNYEKMQGLAKRLIGKNGTRCVLATPGEMIYNPADNTYSDNGPRCEGFCVVSGYEDRLVDGTVIRAGDRKILAVLGGEPKPGLSSLEVFDKTGALKDTYKVINADPTSPDATTIIVYTLHCRK
jgi:hypothetical protein